MTEFLQFGFTLAVVYQITSIISESSFPPFRWLRNLDNILGEFFDCFLCVSVWVGWVMAVILFDPGKYLEFGVFSWIWSGLFYSSLTWFLHLIEGKLS